MRHFLLLAIAAAVSATPAAARQTNDAYEARSVRVSYADLNLATDAGMARFNSRLAGAVKRVCPSGNGMNLQQILDSRRCVAEARASLNTVVAAAVKKQAVALAATPNVAQTGQ